MNCSKPQPTLLKGIQLPRHIRKTSRNWYLNVVTGVFIHRDKIMANISPVEVVSDELIRSKRYDLNYD